MTGAAIVGGDNTGALVGIADGGKIERCYVSNSNIEEETVFRQLLPVFRLV